MKNQETSAESAEKKPSPTSQPTSEVRLPGTERFTAGELERLAVLLLDMMDSQTGHNKRPEQIDGMVRGWCFLMRDQKMKEIILGVEKFCKANPGFPAPADILAIIDPPFSAY